MGVEKTSDAASLTMLFCPELAMGCGIGGLRLSGKDSGMLSGPDGCLWWPGGPGVPDGLRSSERSPNPGRFS